MSVNTEIAGALREIADLLKEQKANPFRVNAYHRTAHPVVSLDETLRDIVAREGIRELTGLPGIGERIARTMYKL